MQFTTLNVAWVVINLIGVLASGRIVVECWKDYRFVERNELNSVREAVSRMSLFNEISRFSTLSFFLLLGLISIVVPQRWFTTTQLEIFNDVIVGLFIAVAVALTITSIAENIARKWIIDSVDRDQ